jgi:sulfatase modifying factor 1
MTARRLTGLMIALLAFFFGAAWCVQAQAPLKKDVFRNSIGMTFVKIPAGRFMMGSPADEPHRDAGETPHPVAITTPFFMQVTEVTLGQWRAIMGRGFFFEKNRGPDNMPVTRVSWHDVQDFLTRLNALNQGRYRLPTEAEWEYAARAGSTRAYSWGDRIDCSRARYAASDYGMDDCRAYARGHGLPEDGPAPVKSYAPNPWGLYDMHGNVWEWVQDWYAPYPPGAQTDPQGPAFGSQKVRRGGSWFKYGYSLRSANRAYAHPASRLQTTGFRLVRIIQK